MVGSKVIVVAAPITSARLTACRRSRSPGSEPVPSLVVLTDQGIGLEGTDVGLGRVEREAALVGGEAGDGNALADGGAAGAEGHGLGRPAIVAQRGEQRIDGAGGGAHLVAGGGEPAGAVPVADQVVTPVLVDRPEEVGADDCGIARDDRVADRRPRVRAAMEDDAAANGGGIAADRARGERRGP